MEPTFIGQADGHAAGIRKRNTSLVAPVNVWTTKDLADGKLHTVYIRWHEAALPAWMPQE